MLFIDEIHTSSVRVPPRAEPSMASNLLKPALSSGQLKCIGATTYTEFRQIFERITPSRRFQKIDVIEPSVAETVEILKGLRAASRSITASSTLPRRSVPQPNCPQDTSTTATCPTRRST